MRSLLGFTSLGRYMFRQIGAVTLFVFVTLTAAIWLTQSLRFVELVVNRGLSADSFFYLTALLLPSFMAILMPISLFTAVLFTYNRLAGDSELVVMRAVGMAPMELARPALAFAALLVACGYAVSLYLLPVSQRAFTAMRATGLGEFSSVFLREGRFNTVADGITIYVRSREANGELRGLIYHDARKPDRPVTIMAERGTLAITEDGPRVIMVQGNRQEVERDAGRLQLLYFDRYSVDLDRIQGEAETDVWRKPSERFLHELFWLSDHPGDKFHAKQMHAEGHNRLVAPLLNLVLTLIALAAILSGDFDRRGQARRIGFGVGAAVLVQAAAIGLHNVITREPSLAPLAYVHVLAVAAIAVWWMTRRRRRRTAPGPLPATA